MATWEDGPEYAPVARPGSFASPEVPALSVAPPRPTPSAQAPAERPRFDQAEKLRELATYGPPPGPERDPNEPYDVVRSTMTEIDSAWSMVHHYHVQGDDPAQWAPPNGNPVGPQQPDPRLPILLAGTPAPPPGPVPGTGPVPGAGPVPATQPEWLPDGGQHREPSVAFGTVFNAVSLPVFMTLLIGGLAMAVPFFGFLSPLMFILAFVTSGRIGYRRHWIRNTFLVATGALVTTIVAGLLMNPVDVLAFADLVYAVSTAICWMVLIAVFLIVWQAIAAGDRPDFPRRASGWD
ncbi:hypothetical protein AADG42_05500 [Ammonicoccus fulvus]|uniref:Uncharacterized protein n=1 Tax=Ammonicoccus fulvus TaxID=3138240 RepID=A0ABZ3FQ84_9ACTN